MEAIDAFTFKTWILAVLGMVGGTITAALGGWDASIQTLMSFMAIDYITGLICAGVFKKSPKSKDGALESKAGWKGLCRKGGTLVVVAVAASLDRIIGTDFARDAVVIGYIINETISITENLGLMGVKIPAPIRKALDILNKKAEGDEGKEHE